MSKQQIVVAGNQQKSSSPVKSALAQDLAALSKSLQARPSELRGPFTARPMAKP